MGTCIANIWRSRNLTDNGRAGVDERSINEANLPTEQQKESQKTRVPASNVDQGWPRNCKGTSSEGTDSPFCLGVELAELCRVRALSSRKSFQRLSKDGKKTRSRNLSLIYRLDESQSTINVAYSVGKKVGKAVTRNKVKRRLRTLIREYSRRMPSGDYLVLVSPKVSERRFDELRDEMRAILPLMNDFEDGGLN